MVATDQALHCFIGTWGFINATLTNTTTATLPSCVDFNLTNQFEFFDDCNVRVLRTSFGDLMQTVFFNRLPAHS
ncbi:hypothetical protein PG994_000714 [Apiospora phragmitis]|uniref:Uncharacterized protein n=1 Tax=Apiospora phragmitis TaxID=2905665 RepID=A0ABR1X719_9PEZI